MSDSPDLQGLSDDDLLRAAISETQNAAVEHGWSERTLDFALGQLYAGTVQGRPTQEAVWREVFPPVLEVDQLQAFRDTVALAEARGLAADPNSDVGLDHLREMLATVEHGAKTFSPAKLGRWLGYAQGVIVAAKVGTLDEMKAINDRHKIVR